MKRQCHETNARVRLSLLGALMGSLALTAAAQSSDALLDKLVQKGILTSQEAKALREEAEAAAPKSRLSMPAWIESVKLSGDLRLRYDSIHSDTVGYADRNRFRYRARFGVIFDMTHDLELGVRLSSGSASNPISNNQTFRNNATRKGIFFDQVYMKWAPLHTDGWKGYLLGGKMKNPITAPATILFDHDYTPEGFAQYLARDITDDHRVSLLLTQFALDDLRSSGHDPFMFGGQVRWDGQWSDRVKTSLGAGGFWITNPESLTAANVPWVGQGNTRNAAGVLVNDYEVFTGDASVTYTFDSAPLYRGKFPVALYGQFINNFGADQDNVAYAIGTRIGKASKAGQWELNYQWRRMEADAWWDQVIESDFGAVWGAAPVGGRSGYFSGSNVQGHWLKGTYAIFDQWHVSVVYFLTDLINDPANGGSKNTGRLFVETSLKY